MNQQFSGRWVQLTVPHEMAHVMKNACAITLMVNQEAKPQDKLQPHVVEALIEMQEFWAYAEINPLAFPPKGTLAASIGSRLRGPRGPAKRSRRPRRSRHQRRIDATKQRRAERRELREDVSAVGNQEDLPLD